MGTIEVSRQAGLDRLQTCFLAVGILVALACSDGNGPVGMGGGGSGGALSAAGSGGHDETRGGGGTAGGGAGGGGSPDLRAWAEGAAGWQRLAGSEFLEGVCNLEVATDVPLTSLDWRPCGDGCEWTESEFPQLAGGGEARPAMGTRRLGDTTAAVLQVERQYSSDGVRWSIRRLVRLDTGATLAVARISTSAADAFVHCSFGTWYSAPLFISMGGTTESDSAQMLGTWHDGWRWHPPWGRTSAGCEMFNEVGDLGTAVCRGHFSVTRHGDRAFEPASEHAAVYAAGSNGAVAAFVNESGPGRSQLLRWLGDGADLLAEVDGSLCRIAVSEEGAVAALHTDGTAYDCFVGHHSYSLWSRIGEEAALLSPIDDGRELLVSALSTHGDWAAFTAENKDSARVGADKIIVKRLSDGREWSFEPHENYAFREVGPALDSRYLYIYESPGFASGIPVGRVYRYALERLDAAAAAR